MGLPSLRHPRFPTNLRSFPLVLGFPIDEPDRQRHSVGQPRHLRSFTDRNRYAHRHLTLGHRHHVIPRSPRLLSPSARPDPELLQIGHAPQDCALVLRHRHHPEFLPLRTIRTQLAIPLELRPRTNMDDRPPGLRILHRRLGSLTRHLLKSLTAAFMDPANVRRRSRRPSLVSDALGYLRHGILGAVGRLTARRRPGGQDPMALARNPRRHPGRRLRHDPPPNPDPLPRRVRLGVRAGVGIRRHHRRSRLRSRRHGSWPYLSEFGCRSARFERSVVLGRLDCADRRLCGLLPLVQEGAVDEALRAEKKKKKNRRRRVFG